MPPLRRLAASCAASLLVFACKNHLPDNGDYTLVADQVFQDDCGLAGSGSALWGVQFIRAGDVVTMPMQFHFIQARGYYLAQSEHFALDGTAEQVATDVRGHACVVDWVGVHIEGDALSANAFSGALRVIYESIMTEACRCELQVHYQGTLAPPT